MKAYSKREKRQIVSTLERHLSARTGVPVAVGLSPIGKYPTSQFEVSLSTGLDFEEKDQGLVETPDFEAIARIVARFDDAMLAACDEFGLSDYGNEHSWNLGHDAGYVLSFTFPPMGFDARQEAEALKYGRWMTEAELQAYRDAHDGDDPYSDEQWIYTHHAGINVFRSAKLDTEKAR